MANFTPTIPLEAALPVFYQYGLQTASNESLALALHTTAPELTAAYPTRDGLVQHVMQADMDRQKREHTELYAHYSTAVERLYGLLQMGLRDMATMPGQFYADLQADFPKSWGIVMDHLADYSAPQLQQLLNDGVRSRLFRSDINIQLVTKILLEQVNMMLNPQIFPPDRFNMSEVFRSIFLYYIRGICTDEGARIAAEHFSRI